MKSNTIKNEVEALKTKTGFPLIYAVISLGNNTAFSYQVASESLGKKRIKLNAGISLIPYDSRHKNITILHAAANKNIIGQITYGGGDFYTLKDLKDEFGEFQIGYNPRDDFSIFRFSSVPKSLNIRELNFILYDEKYTLEGDKVVLNSDEEIALDNLVFNHFTIAF